jgi:hypothetical protein
MMAKQKSVVLSLVLTFFLGPFGMLYSTVLGALIMLVLYVVLGIITLGWAIAVLHPIAMIWGGGGSGESLVVWQTANQE